jgi:hypothetical protein
LEEIFKHLNLSDREAAGLSCKRFFEISCAPAFMALCRVNIFNKKKRETYYPKTIKMSSTFIVFASSTRKFKKFHFEEVNMENKIAEDMWKVISPEIEVLSIYKCKIKSGTLVKFLKTAPRLKTLELSMLLDVDEWRADDFAELANATNIVSLDWFGTHRLISDALFNALVAMMPKVESIKLSCTIAAAQWRFSDDPSYIYHEDEALQLHSLLRFIEKSQKTLKSVYFDDFLLPHGIIDAFITAKPKLNLEYLYLVNLLSHFDTKELTAFLLTQPDLKVLFLNNMVADDATMEAVSKMKNLQELVLRQKSSHCIATDVAIEKLIKLRQLRVSMNFNFLIIT